MMIRTESILIRPSDPCWNEIDHLCFLSKNLYNATLYAVRQEYFSTGTYLNYYNINRIFTHTKQSDYVALPRKVSKHTQMAVDQAFRSFFALCQKKHTGAYEKPVRIPHYLLKVTGRYVVHYPKDALSFRKTGWIRLSQTDLYFPLRRPKECIRYVRLVPKGNHCKVLIGYEVPNVTLRSKEHRYASIDLGLNNLAAVASNVFSPWILNGRPLKHINQYANSKIAKLRSLLPNNQYSSHAIDRIFFKRETKLTDYLHKASRLLVNHFVSHRIDTVIIGYNAGWKQDIKLGRVNNQNFVQIPFARFLHMITYKCEQEGIQVILQEEAHTSKCSFYDDESIEHHDQYKGQRLCRGLFRTSNGQHVNADLNGALNIAKKYLVSQAVWNSRLREDFIEACSTPILSRVTCDVA